MLTRPGEGEPDSVWVTVEFPVALAVVQHFFADTERLLRLHPHLEIGAWRTHPGGGFTLVARNETTGIELRTELQRLDDEPASGFTLVFDQGLKRQTVFRCVACGDRTHVTVTEYYRELSGPDDTRAAEVDSTLTAWIVALQRHLLARQRWGWLPGWHRWNEGFLPRRTPRQRRIVRLLLWISGLEFLIFLAAVLVLRVAV